MHATIPRMHEKRDKLQTQMISNIQTTVPKTITLYSALEEEDDTAKQLKLEVPLQEKYIGTARVIPNSLADVSCADLGLDGLLQILNDIHNTSYSFSVPPEEVEEVVDDDADDHGDEWSDVTDYDDMFDQPFDAYQHPSALASVLLPFVHQRSDFGTAYAHLRPWWAQLADAARAKRQMLLCEMDDAATRELALSQWAHQSAPTIDPPDTPPRRVWDLFANRVVPAHVVTQAGARGPHPHGGACARVVGVSHSWVRAEERRDVHTPINGRAWPVPIPADTTLARVRVELLNLGLEHAWLDVLCLRQASADPTNEALRADEWALDVPTIGNVYRGARVVHYYSGLGRAFRVGDMADERHWLNRAWTLQEISPSSTVAGLAPCSPTLPPLGAPLARVPEPTRTFAARLAALAAFSARAAHVFPVLAAMRHRACTGALDRVCGLAYLLRARRLPPYAPAAGAEGAWARFLETVDACYRGDLLLLFPAPGARALRWAPSWAQVQDARVLPECEGIELAEDVWYDSSWHIYRHKGPRIDDARIEGLASSTSDETRTGSITVRDGAGTDHAFAILAEHEQLIPDGEYLIQGSANYQFWVIGVIGPEIPDTRGKGTVVKVSVFRLSKDEAQGLEALGLAEVKETGFV